MAASARSREFLHVDADAITDFIDCLDRWARPRALQRPEAEYVSATRDRRPLRVIAGAPAIERGCMTNTLDLA